MKWLLLTFLLGAAVAQAAEPATSPPAGPTPAEIADAMAAKEAVMESALNAALLREAHANALLRAAESQAKLARDKSVPKGIPGRNPADPPK